MRKTMFVFLVFLFSIVFAKDNNLGIKLWGGIVHSKLNAENSILSYGPYNNARKANCMGGQVDIKVTNHISAGIGISYINSGGITNKQIGTDMNSGLLGGFYVAQKLQYIEIPIHIKYIWKKKLINPFITTGITYGNLLSAKEVLEFENNNTYKMEKKIDKYIKNNNYSFDIGFGTEIPFTDYFGFFIMLNNSFGLTNQFDTNDSDVKQKQNKFVYMIGTSFYI